MTFAAEDARRKRHLLALALSELLTTACIAAYAALRR